MLSRKAIQDWTINFLIATTLGATSFYFAQPVIQRFYRDPKYATQLETIKELEKGMKKNKKFDNLPFWFESEHRKKLEDALSNLKRGREKTARRLMEEVYADFSRRINENLELKQKIREIRKTDFFKQQRRVEKSRRNRGAAYGAVTGGTIFTVGSFLRRKRKQQKGIPHRPRRGRRGS